MSAGSEAGTREPQLCAGTVVVEAGELLLVRRAHEPEAGRWSLPGGRVEAGERPEQAAARETLEETGCSVTVGRLAGEALVPPGVGTFRVLDFYAFLEEPPGRPRAGSDASEAALVPLDRVGELDLVSGLEQWLRRHGVLAPAPTERAPTQPDPTRPSALG